MFSIRLTDASYDGRIDMSNTKDVSPEIVAVITAAVQQMMGDKVIAVKVKRSDVWAQFARGGRR
jgi:methylmalonyl-CoA carboxyltransferase large subunit